MLKSLALLPLLLLFMLSACSEDPGQKEAEKIVREFYTALRANDTLVMQIIYPDIVKIRGFYKSTKFEITETETIGNETYKIHLDNSFQNDLGTKFNQKITFFVKKDSTAKRKYIISNSKGIFGFSETREYQFAKSTGFISKNKTLNDVEIADCILESEKLLELLFKKRIEQLRSELVIDNWGWEYGYDQNHANGHGRVTNHSKNEFSSLKYVLTFVAPDGSVTHTDEGYLLYDTFKPNQSAEFTTSSSGIGNATKAYIQINFDTYELLDHLYEAKYTGNESKLIH